MTYAIADKMQRAGKGGYMIYITGDTHRDFERIFDFCEENGTTKDDVLVILGDAGTGGLAGGLRSHPRRAKAV